jgi:hypothetical protein
MQVQVGDVIRSYDFKPMVGRNDCYVEGKVLEVKDTSNGYDAYRIKVTRDYWDGEDRNWVGEDSRVGQITYVPWKVSFMEYDGRVINLSR